MSLKSRTRICFGGTLSVRVANATKLRLGEALANFEVIEIDVSGLASVDVSIVQLLISLRKSAEREGKKLAIATGTTETLQKFLAQAGLLAPAGASRSTDEEFWLGGQHAEGRVA